MRRSDSTLRVRSASVQASDTFFSFHQFMNAYDVQVVDADGKLTLDQPKNKSGLTRALADYAILIGYLKKGVGNGTVPSATSAPVIAFGGSYGGMLASWFRIKYPHVVVG